MAGKSNFEADALSQIPWQGKSGDVSIIDKATIRAFLSISTMGNWTILKSYMECASINNPPTSTTNKSMVELYVSNKVSIKVPDVMTKFTNADWTEPGSYDPKDHHLD